ncbi:hypothetical protein POX_a01770 [Penicillium oxalicum]|uniref:hypothetical protein n=1 Tax=Penicillium oxalicum TaxID=69781 RepID=UPI0020B85A71|nr:hypothetical protein POX_a01770 [Penicillium oxalicum]KAI2795165.1 hypothetical protein POX_a01770 [Penicillium oxalicum]
MDSQAHRSAGRPRAPSRPTTPLRPSSRSSFRETYSYGHTIGSAGYNQPAINALEPQFAELPDSMADLEANFMHLQLMHESLTRFSESFASFLYGMNMNAFCVDFPEAPIPDSFQRAKQTEAQAGRLQMGLYRRHSGFQLDSGTVLTLFSTETEDEPVMRPDDGEMTFLTTDTSFVEHPPSTVSSKPSRAPAFGRGASRGASRGTATRGTTRGTTRGITRGPTTGRYATRGSDRGRPSALPRGRGLR